MTGEAPEVRSDKMLNLLDFQHSTFDFCDINCIDTVKRLSVTLVTSVATMASVKTENLRWIYT